jgi:hypothetical protein
MWIKVSETFFLAIFLLELYPNFIVLSVQMIQHKINFIFSYSALYFEALRGGVFYLLRTFK